MACINMYNPDHGHSHYHHQSSSSGGGGGSGGSGFMSPRISFSSDFVLDSSGGPCIKYEGRRPRAAADTDPDFEFSASPSVAAQPMMAADELFFKGRLLPLREQQRHQRSRPTTIREELLAGPEEADAPAAAPARKSSGGMRWKGLLGLRKPQQQRHQGPTPAHLVPGRRATDGPLEINSSQEPMKVDELGDDS